MDSGRSGGKIVRDRRRRDPLGPYDRPPPPPPAEQKSPNWLTGHVFPATRTIFSGAAKLLTSVFNSDSASSSSDDDDEDVDSMSEDDAREENDVVSEVNELNKDPQFSTLSSKKHLIERLLLQETFSRKECDHLVSVINSRVVDFSSGEGEGNFGLHAAVPDQTIDTLDLSSRAIKEARKWLEEKREGKVDGLGSDITIRGSSSAVQTVDDTYGSPVDMAKSYMKVRPPWASPVVDQSGLGTPLRMKAKLFEEGTPYTVSGGSSSSLKKKSSFASGSWNIQEELRKVRTKATEDLLRALPSKKIGNQLHFSECNVEPKLAAGDPLGEKINDSSSLRLAKLSDVPIDWSDVEITQDGGEIETQPLNPASSSQLQEQGTETIRVDEHAARESRMPSGPIFPSEHSDGLHVAGGVAQEVTRPNKSQSSNGYVSLEASLSAGKTSGQNNVHVGDEEAKSGLDSRDKLSESVQVDKCELLTESAVDVPDANEVPESSAASMPSEELSQEEPSLVHGLSKNEKVMKQGKRPARYATRQTRAKR